MTYDELKHVWISALRESTLPLLGIDPVQETIDLRSMDRSAKSFVGPLGQDAEPFHIGASLSWRWDSLNTARTATTEEDLLTELLGRESGSRVKTERPWLRIDVSLRASLPHGRLIPMPSSEVWAMWAHEAIGRLEAIEPIVPEKRTRPGRAGLLEYLAWQGEPIARVRCGLGGELQLEAVELSSWQAIDLPRKWDDSSRKPDKPPGEQLHAMFARVKAALHAWMEVMDHLRPRS